MQRDSDNNKVVKFKAGNLDKLPIEIVLLIFSFLPESDLGRLALVCKKVKELSQDDSLWRKFFSAGDLDNIPSEVLLAIFSHLGAKDLASLALVCKKTKELSEENSIWNKFYNRTRYTLYEGLNLKKELRHQMMLEKFKDIRPLSANYMVSGTNFACVKRLVDMYCRKTLRQKSFYSQQYEFSSILRDEKYRFMSYPFDSGILKILFELEYIQNGIYTPSRHNYRNKNCVILVVDLQSKAPYRKIRKCLYELRSKYFDGKIFLIGTYEDQSKLNLSRGDLQKIVKDTDEISKCFSVCINDFEEVNQAFSEINESVVSQLKALEKQEPTDSETEINRSSSGESRKPNCICM